MNRFDYDDKDFPGHMFKMLASFQPNDIVTVGEESWKILSNHQTYFLYEVIDAEQPLPEPYLKVATND